jgi:hypothetical protein
MFMMKPWHDISGPGNVWPLQILLARHRTAMSRRPLLPCGSEPKAERTSYSGLLTCLDDVSLWFLPETDPCRAFDAISLRWLRRLSALARPARRGRGRGRRHSPDHGRLRSLTNTRTLRFTTHRGLTFDVRQKGYVGLEELYPSVDHLGSSKLVDRGHSAATIKHWNQA